MTKLLEWSLKLLDVVKTVLLVLFVTLLSGCLLALIAMFIGYLIAGLISIF